MTEKLDGTPPTMIPLEQVFPGIIQPDNPERLTIVNAPARTRLLIRRSNRSAEPVTEVTVLEWSPTGTRVKLEYLDGSVEWCSDGALPLLVEVLNDAN